jgi:adenosylcobinamide kinase/adenosylcobinamide-phosphate guanylyltransferase
LGAVAASAPKVLLVVTNETGLGIIPADSSSRRYRDDLGWINQRLATAAGAVFFSVAGIAQRLK